jgi:hypothetical protein
VGKELDKKLNLALREFYDFFLNSNLNISMNYLGFISS